MITLLKNSDRVTSASLAQLVNVIAPIMTEPGGPAWRQSTFWPFSKTAELANGVVIRPAIAAESYDTVQYGSAPLIDAVATFDEDRGAAAAFLVNRSQTEYVSIDMDVRSIGPLSKVSATSLWDDEDVHAKNTLTEQDRVILRPNVSATLDAGKVRVVLPPVSWTAVSMR